MPEYIERSDAAEYFEKSKQTMWHKDDVVATISSKSNIPADDVVEVVRCKDCKWWEARVYGSTIGKCENPRNGLINDYTEDNDFCSYGERSGK